MNSETLVAASLLSADFSNMGDGVKTAVAAGADWIHLDVMDGAFVPNLTFGPKMVSDLRPHSSLPFDVHLMVENPESLVEEFVKAGSDYVTVHLEASVHLHRLLGAIRDLGASPGVSIVPSSPVSLLKEVLPLVDIILIMTVNPGFGGQALIPSCLDKVSQLAALRESEGYQYLIEVDGGVNRSTAGSIRKAGADVLISGSAFFASDTPEKEVQIFKGTVSD